MKLELESTLQQSLHLETNVGPAGRQGCGALRTRTGGGVDIVFGSGCPCRAALDLKKPNVVCGFDQVFDSGIDYVEHPAGIDADHRPMRAVRIGWFHGYRIELQRAGW